MAHLPRSGRRARGAATRATLRGAVLSCLVASAWGQQNDTRPYALQPYASVSETVTDNLNLSADKQSDVVSKVTGGLSARGRSARWQGNVDLSLSRLQYAKQHGDSRFQSDANGSFFGDLVEDRVRLDGGLTLSRRALSPFGSTLGGTELANANNARTLSWRLGPTARGPLGEDLRYTGRYQASGTTVGGQSNGNSITQVMGAQLMPLRDRRLSWLLDASRQAVTYKQGRNTLDDRVQGQLSYAIDPLEWSVSGRMGREFSNVSTLDRTTTNTWGLSTVWTPSARTRLDANFDHRYFGRAHQLRLEHRTARTSWQLSTSRDVTTSSSASTLAGSAGTLYDLYNLQLMSTYSDAAQRADAVLALLQRNRLSALAVPDTNLLSSAATLTQRVELSGAWRGQRDTAVVKFGHSQSYRVDALAQAIDLLANSSRIDTRDLGLTLNHQLTSDSALGFDVSLYDATGVNADQHTFQRLFNLTWSATLGRNVTGSMGLRHGVYLVHPSSYTESALTATLGARF